MHRRQILTLLLAGITLPLSLTAKAGQTVLAARTWRQNGTSRVVLDLSGPVTYQAFELDAPPRLILDLHGTRLTSTLNEATLRQGPVKQVRSSLRPNGDTRLVFEFDQPIKTSAFALPPGSGKGNRLVIDLHSGAAPALASAKATQPPAAQAQLAKADPAPTPGKGHRDVIVVIDAGHGGKDPGAIGAGGQQEKHVALAIAQMLARKVNQTKGYKARLVRNDDFFVPLRKRVDVARKYNADMFVSVHADAAPNRTAKGASVFALSEHGATSTLARWMADQENASDLIGARQLLNISDKDPMLANVILDMSMNATISSSLSLGGNVLDSVGGVSGVHGVKRVEQAGFAVLKSPDIPSILVETGFISNSRDCSRLMDTRHRQKVAQAIFTGISGYFANNPPMGTYLAAARSGGLA
ncbi:N-acetylmuramoyl-L-alanine amidase [Pseudomonas sp. NPDC007930]|uniref:N-acetylmuramoyl-L-alanine amidase n=1 Tax=Pseudomonas sp. NPDC007930 TaxID=3364417 RepID=UPI0036E20FD1